MMKISNKLASLFSNKINLYTILSITFKRLNLQLSTTKKREVDNDEILSILVRSIRKEIYVASYCKGYP